MLDVVRMRVVSRTGLVGSGRVRAYICQNVSGLLGACWSNLLVSL